MCQSPRAQRRGRDRALSPVVGVVVLLAMAVILAGSIAIVFGSVSPPEPGPVAVFDLHADGDDSRITLEHTRGDPVDVDDLSVTVEVNGEPLDHQPPVPFVSSAGFMWPPSGPFNAQSDSTWEPGERASVHVAGTNDPQIEPGDEVAVTLAVDGHVIAELETTAA